MPFTDRELFAKLIKCEAGGEGDDGMKAVATTVMNRTNIPYGEFARVSQGGNLRNILFQPRQYTCMMDVVNSQYNPQNIYNMDPEEIHYEIADWAIENNKFSGVGDSIFYFNPFKPTCVQYFPPNGTGEFYSRINQHCFYSPTAAYYET